MAASSLACSVAPPEEAAASSSGKIEQRPTMGEEPTGSPTLYPFVLVGGVATVLVGGVATSEDFAGFKDVADSGDADGHGVGNPLERVPRATLVGFDRIRFYRALAYDLAARGY